MCSCYKRKTRMLMIVLLTAFFSGCAVHYKNVPSEMASGPDFGTGLKTFFTVFERPIVSGGGPETIATTLISNKYFSNAVRLYDEEVPAEGVYVLVNPHYQAPSLSALAFGYLSISTLTLLPAWSNEDGFDLQYSVYVDGALIKTYRYETRRFLATWAGLLPFIWVNLLTSGEEEAFEAITLQFLSDASPVLSALSDQGS